MNISKNGKTLYFSEDEIENETNGEKKVFVTKRINGKETHTKIEKNKTIQDAFNLNNEIVLGVTPKNNNNQSKSKNDKIKKEKNRRNYKNDNRNVKKRKKKKLNKKFLIFITMLFLIISVLVFAFKSPIFNIKDIEVEGNEKIAKETIINLSEIKIGENIFKYNHQAITKIKENRYVNDVKISRKLPNTVNIQIEERKVKYKTNLINSYTYIDQNGYILENSTIFVNVPTVTGLCITENEQINNKRLNIEDLKKLNNINKIMEAIESINMENVISEINIESENNYVLIMENEKKKVYIGDSMNLTNKVLFLKSIIEKEKDHSGIIFLNGDINAGFQPYFREEG